MSDSSWWVIIGTGLPDRKCYPQRSGLREPQSGLAAVAVSLPAQPGVIKQEQAFEEDNAKNR